MVRAGTDVVARPGTVRQMAAIELDAIEQRVIGSLLEKERTVPDTYPMTLNGVRTACNQTSGRDPVLSLGELEVQAGLDRLRAQGLTRVIHPSHGARTPKHRQVLDEVLGLDPARARRRHPAPPARRRRRPASSDRGRIGSTTSTRSTRSTPRSTCWRSATSRSSRSCPASRVRRRRGGSTASARWTRPAGRDRTPPCSRPGRRGTRRSSRRTTRSPPRTPTSSSTSSTASPSTGGCSSASPTSPTAVRWPTSAADRDRPPRTSRWPAPTSPASTSRPAWSRRRGAGSRTSPSRSPT